MLRTALHAPPKTLPKISLALTMKSEPRIDNGPSEGHRQEWTDQSGFTSNMTHARAAHASAVYQGRCIVAGGWDDSYRTIDTVEWHHPYLDQWTELGSLFIPRHLHGLVCLDSQLYAVGGFDHHGNSEFMHATTAWFLPVQKPHRGDTFVFAMCAGLDRCLLLAESQMLDLPQRSSPPVMGGWFYLYFH